MDKKYLILLFLATIVFGRMVIFPTPFTDTVMTGGDHNAHIHKIQFLKDNGAQFWDSYWYGGTPLTRFYPPLAYYIASLVPLDEINAYNLSFMLFFALTPVAFYFLLKEFKLSLKKMMLATALFSFTMYYNSIVFFGQYPTIVSIFFSLLFLKFFIRSLNRDTYLNGAIAAVFLGITAVTHLLATVMIVILSLVYLASVFYVKRDCKRMLGSILAYPLGFLVSAFWTFPFLWELKYSFFESGSPQYAGFLSSVPVAGILRIYSGLSINLIAILIALLGSALLLAGILKNMKKDVESIFLSASTVLFLGAYFIIYFLMHSFSFDPTRFIVLWPIPFSIMLAKLWDDRILKWLVAVLLVSQIVLFFGTPMPMSNSWTQYQTSLSGLAHDGRVAIEPEELLYLTPEYIPAASGFEGAYGNLYMGLTPARAKFIEQNRLFRCFDNIPLSEKLLSFDVFSRQYQKIVPCRLSNPDYKEFFTEQYVRYVVVDKAYPYLSSIFENDSEFSKVKETEVYSIYRFNRDISDIDGISGTIEKTANSISLRLYSPDAENVHIRISESWYPYWKSNDIDIGPDENGYISFIVPEINGEKDITIVVREPWYVNASLWASIISAAGLLVYIASVKGLFRGGWPAPLARAGNRPSRKSRNSSRRTRKT